MTFTPRHKVSYFYDSEVGNYYYAQGHPMKPHRMRMTHNLLLAYGLLEKMDVLATPRAAQRDMTRFHSDEYISFLNSITPETLHDQANANSLCRFNVLEDCPVFDGLWEYCQIAAGGSLAGASRLNAGSSSVAINWAGGLHHAKKAEASGFCYINDCVLAILELLKMHARVLYVDIDIHHGDGVEEAFYTTDRVMTASFHKFGDYFPGTGDVTDIGVARGKHYSANFPLRDGIDDESYREIFVPVMSRIMEWYQPGAVVLQCGADSLSGDRLGCFNLSLLGHAQCVDFFKRYHIPLLLLGGGGYTIRNVARCWAYETSRVVGETLSDELPYNDNYEFYGPEFRLHIVPSNMENHNGPAELQKTKMQIFENLRHLPHAPSVPMIDTPRVSPLALSRREEDTFTATVAADDDEDDPDTRKRSRRPRTLIDYAGSDEEFDDQFIYSLRYAARKYKRINFARRRFPSAVLDSEKSRDEETADGQAENMSGESVIVDPPTTSKRRTSVSSSAVLHEPWKRRWTPDSQYFDNSQDNAKEDSRLTVSGTSDVKDDRMVDVANDVAELSLRVGFKSGKNSIHGRERRKDSFSKNEAVKSDENTVSERKPGKCDIRSKKSRQEGRQKGSTIANGGVVYENIHRINNRLEQGSGILTAQTSTIGIREVSDGAQRKGPKTERITSDASMSDARDRKPAKVTSQWWVKPRSWGGTHDEKSPHRRGMDSGDETEEERAAKRLELEVKERNETSYGEKNRTGRFDPDNVLKKKERHSDSSEGEEVKENGGDNREVQAMDFDTEDANESKTRRIVKDIAKHEHAQVNIEEGDAGDDGDDERDYDDDRQDGGVSPEMEKDDRKRYDASEDGGDRRNEGDISRLDDRRENGYPNGGGVETGENAPKGNNINGMNNDSDDSMGKINETRDNKNGETSRMETKLADELEHGSSNMRIRGARMPDRRKGWFPKRRAVLDDGSSSEDKRKELRHDKTSAGNSKSPTSPENKEPSASGGGDNVSGEGEQPNSANT